MRAHAATAHAHDAHNTLRHLSIQEASARTQGESKPSPRPTPTQPGTKQACTHARQAGEQRAAAATPKRTPQAHKGVQTPQTHTYRCHAGKRRHTQAQACGT
eukprot:scaffold2074_cov118-Isochrysis_galbana.AAC.1